MSDINKARTEANRLKTVIQENQRRLREAQQQLETIENQCGHNWKITYTPDYQAAYTIQGDPPGTMGVDWRGPVSVPSKTTPKWTRTCSICQRIETTTQTKKTQGSGPIPGTIAWIDEPYFYERRP